MKQGEELHKLQKEFQRKREFEIEKMTRLQARNLELEN